jgi:hypothetical protein
MKNNILLSLFLLFALRAVEAQQMDLNQCIRYALDNNLAITNKNLEESFNNELYMQTKRMQMCLLPVRTEPEKR